jgi:hypothetical protein
MGIQDSLREFQREVDDFLDDVVPKRAWNMQYRIILEAITKIVKRTPVDTGRARANWQLTKSQPSTRVFKKTDPEGDETIAKAMRVLDRMDPYSTFFISNNLDYIEYLEEGSSKQAPYGMVAVTVEELRARYFE